MQIVESSGTRYILRVARLWEQDESDLFQKLKSAGLPVESVRKVVLNQRGYLQIDLSESLDDESVLIFEAAGAAGERPLDSHVYKLKKEFLARPLARTFTMDPLKLKKGVLLKEVGRFSNGSWTLLVLTGDHVGTHALFTSDEWDLAAPNLVDLGTELTMGKVSAEAMSDPTSGKNDLDADDEAPDNSSKNPIARNSSDLKTDGGSIGGKKGRSEFPPFPDRKPLSSYKAKGGAKPKPKKKPEEEDE